jgi:2-iminobutanoate/2-iminopropanoate deaminase
MLASVVEGPVRYHRAMPRQTIATPDAPKAIGPYAQAISVPAGRLVFCSGQIPLHPKTGEMVGAGDVRAQTERVLENLAAVLAAAGASFADVVKTTIFLTDLGDFAVVNEVYARFVGASPPARATVQVAGLPKGASVEIEAIAVLPPTPSGA